MHDRIKRILSAVMSTGIPLFRVHEGCFELLEAHFVIDEHYNPWLINFKRQINLDLKTKAERDFIPRIIENVSPCLEIFNLLTIC